MTFVWDWAICVCLKAVDIWTQANTALYCWRTNKQTLPGHTYLCHRLDDHCDGIGHNHARSKVSFMNFDTLTFINFGFHSGTRPLEAWIYSHEHRPNGKDLPIHTRFILLVACLATDLLSPCSLEWTSKWSFFMDIFGEARKKRFSISKPKCLKSAV